MKVILFGATGMVGQGVLRECLLDPEIAEVLAIGAGRGSGTRSCARLCSRTYSICRRLRNN